MKEEFKKWIQLHKGKPLDKEMIKMIAEMHESEIHSLLYNNGLVLTYEENNDIIQYGDDKDWAVKDYQWNTKREFKTLKGAIKYIQK